MIVTCVYVQVNEQFINDFISECRKNHNESVKEPGNMRFDVIQQVENPSNFMLYEAYIDEATANAHKQTEHYKVWRQNVEHMMAQPRSGVKHTIICPNEFEK